MFSNYSSENQSFQFNCFRCSSRIAAGSLSCCNELHHYLLLLLFFPNLSKNLNLITIAGFTVLTAKGSLVNAMELNHLPAARSATSFSVLLKSFFLSRRYFVSNGVQR
jgi:hypothetical protein